MAEVTEVLRRLYHDLVVRRSSVRIVTASAGVNSTSQPIFLVGAYRSGTTLLRYILDSHSQICAPPESDFLCPLSELVDESLPYVSRLASLGFEREHILGKIREIALYIFNNYAASTGKARWADKTPKYVDLLEFIRELFPNAQFVLIYRHGLDQAHSYTRGGTLMRTEIQEYFNEHEDLRLGAVRYWVNVAAKMQVFQRRYPDQCHTVRYEDLCCNPRDVLLSVFEFLNEPWEPAVLSYYANPHDIGAEDGRAAVTRSIRFSGNHYRSWPATLYADAFRIAAPTLRRLGYTGE